MKKSLLFLLFICAFTLLTACSNQNPTDTTEDNEQETNDPEQAEPEPEQSATQQTYPFTGKKTTEDVNNRAVAVMVNNYSKARPQSGLSQADLVFEILAEGNITRFIAFFQSETPDVVGPVRSAREYYFNLAKDYNALYVYHGAANFIEEDLRSGVVDNLNGAYYDNDGNLFKRESFRQAPHNSYLLFDSVYDIAKEKGYEITQDHQALPFLAEGEVDTITGEDANQVSISYSSTASETVHYKYDEASEQYLRFNGDAQTVELNSEEPIRLDNVFIIATDHEVIDDAGRRSVDLKSGGNAYLLQKGKVQKIQWKNVDGKILPYKDEEPVKFVPGNTWINVVPEESGLDGIVNIHAQNE